MSETYPDPNCSAEWLRTSCKMTVSPFGEEVAHILGRVYRGIHNAPINLRKKGAESLFEDDRYIRLVVHGTLSTVDFDDLTRLVILCHDLHVRCEIGAVAPGYMELCFARRLREGGTWDAHPTMDEAVAYFRNRTEWRKPRAKVAA